MSAPGRRGFLLGGAAMLVGAAPLSSQALLEYAAFTEFSPNTKPMKPGWNRRVFTDTDARRGTAIQCDFTTGIVTLAPGTYHFSGLSMVTYYTDSDPAETTAIRSPAAAGYCRLRTLDPERRDDSQNLRAIDNADRSVICIGSTSNANMVPSLFEGFLEAASPVQIVLEHQCGANPQQIYLRVMAQNSRWHAAARLAVRRL
ncbi:MAG: hypothetical protein FJX11_10360 [Alphaproteobacteria bacterium]|nr:hypothetical protein [Alphaproteobacteria bacterium]